MARSIGKPELTEVESKVSDPKEQVPKLDDLMRRQEIPDYLKILPPPKLPGDPFGPVPTMPRLPLEPTWPYGPPYLGGPPLRGPVLGPSMDDFSPQNSPAPAGLLGMMERSGVIDPSILQGPSAGGLFALLQEYLLSDRQRSR